MVKFLSFLLSVFLFSSCEYKIAKQREAIVTDTLPTILIAGLGDMTRDNIQNLVAKKYGFKFLRIGGCVVSKQLADSMRLHNEKVHKEFEKINGKYWRDRLYEEINVAEELQYQIENVLSHDPEIVLKNEAFGKKEYEMLYEFDLCGGKNILNIQAYDLNDISGVVKKRIYYTLSIDTSVDRRFSAAAF